MSPRPSAPRWAILAAILVGTFVGTLGNSLTNIAVPAIMDEFRVPLSSAVWVVTTYVLILAVLMPVGGYLGDLYGQRRVYLWGIVLYALATLLISLAPTFSWLLAGRVLLGIGIAPTLPAVMAIIAGTFSPGERGRALGFWALANGAGHVLGPALSGFLTQAVSWRASFLIMFPLCIVNVAAVLWLVPHDQSRAQRPFDVLGAATLTAMALGLMLALTQGARWGWTSPSSLVLWALALAALSVFVVVEWRVASPFVDLALFANRGYTAAVMVIAAQSFCLFGLLLAVPIFLIQVQGWSSQDAGLMILPLPLAMSLAAPPAGRLADAWGSRRTCTLGLALVLLGSLALLAWQPAQSQAVSWWRLGTGLLLLGTGMGLTQSPVTAAVTGIVGQEQMGVATGIFHMGRFVSGSLGSTVFGLLLELNPAGMAAGFQQDLLVVLVTTGAALAAALFLPGRLQAESSLRSA